eukprot:scaffold259_cov158-Amphora_coffeaeformis.AAC.6
MVRVNETLCFGPFSVCVKLPTPSGQPLPSRNPSGTSIVAPGTRTKMPIHSVPEEIVNVTGSPTTTVVVPVNGVSFRAMSILPAAKDPDEAP